MRFKIVCDVSDQVIPLDYRRKILSMIKKGLESTDKEKYQELYESNTFKEFTFSVYFGQAIFQKNVIQLKDNKFILNISTANMELAFYLYNCLTSLRFKKLDWGNGLSVKIQSVSRVPQPSITEDCVVLKTLSPIVVRDHNKETSKDWFYSVEAPEFLEILKRNMVSSLVPILGEYIRYDVEELELKPINMKKTVVRFYDRQVECSLGCFSLSGKPHLLNYLMQSGIGSLTGSGFGMCELQ